MRPLVDMGETFQDISRRSGLLRPLFLFFVLAIALLARGMTNEALAQACEQGTFSQCHAEGVKQIETKSYPAALGLFVRGCENADQTSCEAIAKLVVERPILRRNRAARKTLKTACERKVGPACTQHGVLKLSRRNSDIRRARQDFQKGCELGDGSGCRRLGEMVEATELAVAQQSYVKACELGDDASCGHSGRLLAATDATAAVPLLIRGCDVLNAKACGALGRLHELGGFAGSDIKEAESAYQRGCDGGDTVSCGRLGSILFRRGDSKEAEPRLRTACKAKQAIHCTELGELLSTQSDTKSARRFFTQARVANQRSCRQGNGAACQNVSQDYQLGRGVRTSSAQADRWLERGCIAGIADKKGCLNIGLALATPRGLRRAQPILGPLCDAGELRACLALAPIVLSSSRQEALYRRACELGDSLACSQVPGEVNADALALAAKGAAEAEAAAGGEGSASAKPDVKLAEITNNSGILSPPPKSDGESTSPATAVATIAAAEAAQRLAEANAQHAKMSARDAEEARLRAEGQQRKADAAAQAAKHREAVALARVAQAVAQETAQRERANEAQARESAAHQEALRASERESLARKEAKEAGIREAKARERARTGEASARQEAKQAALREAKLKRLALLAAAKEAKSRKRAKKVALAQARNRERAEKAIASLAVSRKKSEESAARESTARAQAQASAAKAREALNAEAKENVARVRAEKREGEQRVRVQRLATAKREAEAREAQERKRAEQATAREAEQTRLAATREVARKRAAQAAKKEKEARLQAESRAKEARKVAKAAEELEAEARHQSEEAMAARTVAVAAAAKEAALRRKAQAREAEQRRRAQQAEAKERATRKLAAAREAKALRVAKAAALREAAARTRAKEAAAREAVARKQAEDRDAEEKRKAQRIAAREAAARKAAEKIAAREAAARKAAEKIAAREAAARIAAEKREAVQRARAEALAAKAAVAQEKANKREEKLRQAIKRAEAKQVEANRRREAQRLVQRKAATKRVAAQRKEASRQVAAKRAEAARALAERARVGEERREAAVLKARLQREKKSASKINTVDIDQLELACEAKHRWSCETAGIRLRDGDGVTADPQRALGFLERACLGGSSSACRAALPLLARKSSTEQSRLVQLRTAACTNGAGNAGACERAATTLLKAKNKKGRAQAAALALRGCELKSSRACAIAGDIAIESPVNRDEAAALYDRACSPGGREGCAGLASLCRKGFLSACERLIGKLQKEQVPAKSVLAKAATLRRSGDDLGAAQVLLLAIREETTPRIQAELGLAFQGSGKFVEAERYLAKSLDTTDSWIDAHRPGLERILTHAKSRLGWIVLKCNSGDEKGLVAGVKVRCNRPLRIAVGEHIVEVRAPNRLSSMVTANVVQNSRAMVRATLEVHHCEKPGMLHIAGAEGGCCWPGQRWTSGTCSGESTNGAMASVSSASASSSGSGGLAPLRIRLLGGVTNFVGSSLFRSGVNASAESTSFGPRGELRVGLHLASSFTLEAIMGGSRKSFSHWGDCDGGTSDCASAFPFTDTIDFGAMLQMHTNPTRDGGNLDLHVGVGVRPWTRIELDGAGGPAKLTSTVVPGELGASLFLGSRVSLDVLGQGELWLPWKYCDTECVGSKSVQTAFAWSALGGLTVHID